MVPLKAGITIQEGGEIQKRPDIRQNPANVLVDTKAHELAYISLCAVLDIFQLVQGFFH